MPENGPLKLPNEAWDLIEASTALRERDVAGLLGIAQRYTGASQSRIATAVGLGQSRTNEIFRGRRRVLSHDVMERVASGLAMPDSARMLFGLAPTMAAGARSVADLTGVITRTFSTPAAATREIRAAINAARAIDVLAVRGLGLLGLNDSKMRRAMSVPRQQPLAIRVALLSPDSRFAAERAAEIGESIEVFAQGVRLSEQHLADLDRLDSLDVEVYRYDALPSWRIIAVDDVIFVGAFGQAGSAGTAGEVGSAAMYRLDPGTGGALHRGMRLMCDGVFAQAIRSR